MKRDDEKNELFFKNLASAYTEKDGEELKKELELINSSKNYPYYDAKLKSRVNKAKRKKRSARLLPLAACFVAVIIYSVVFLPKYTTDMTENPTAILDFDFVSARLPENCTLRKMDYDEGQTIYYISSREENGENEIILTVEKFESGMRTEGLSKIEINDTEAYAEVKEEYSLLKYKKDNMLYIFTSQYDLEALIRISENLI